MSIIPIKKLGTVDYFIVEANPVVWNNQLLRLEYIRWMNENKRYPDNESGTSYFRFVEHETGRVVSEPFGKGLHMGNAFVWEGTPQRMVVTCVEDWGRPRFLQLESEDLVHWSEPRVILENESWAGYNTSVCRAGDRFVMMFELGKPLELVGHPFTMFFAESRNLKTWNVIPGASLFKDIYTGAPMLRWFNGVFYAFYLNGSYENGFETYVARSSDLKHWESAPRNPVLTYDEGDRMIHPMSKLKPQHLELAKTAQNINVSDLDFCEYNGKLHMVYSWGNQRGIEFLALAEAECTERQFCESFF